MPLGLANPLRLHSSSCARCTRLRPFSSEGNPVESNNDSYRVFLVEPLLSHTQGAQIKDLSKRFVWEPFSPVLKLKSFETGGLALSSLDFSKLEAHDFVFPLAHKRRKDSSQQPLSGTYTC